MRISVFRPGGAFRRTMFENQLALYAHVQKAYGIQFRIIVDEESYEEDERFEWVRLNQLEWRSFRGQHFFLWRNSKVRHLLNALSDSDVILTIDPTVYPQALLALDAARKLGVPTWLDATITLQTERHFDRWTRSGYYQCVSALNQSTRILVPTPKVIERFAHLRLLSPEIVTKFCILGHAVDTDTFSPDPLKVEIASGHRDILCVSRLVPAKGISYILEAFLQIKSTFPDTRLIFVGSGVMEAYVRSQAPRRLLDKRIIIRPPIHHHALPEIYQSASVYISHALATPSWEEYFGVCNLEAMACGVPAILSESGGVTWSARSPARPYWVAERDVSGIIEQLKRILSLSQPELDARIQENRNFVINNYSLDIVAKRFVSGLAPLLNSDTAMSTATPSTTCL